MKDPAFLFYSESFLSGVADLTMEERGQFITLLCLQHQKGELTEKTIRLNVGSVSVDVLNKFCLLENQNYVNLRLKEEIEKRSHYTASRRENGKKGGRPKVKNTQKEENNEIQNLNDSEIEPYGYRMDSHMRNINININKDKNIDKNIEKGVQGEKQNFGKNPRFDDPTLAGVNAPDPYQPDGVELRQHTGIAADMIATAFERYKNKCIANSEYRDRRGHLAAFKNYCESWARNEEKAKKVLSTHPSKNNAAESILETKAKLQALAALYE